MSTKTITIGTDAYARLKSLKHEHESFTDVIMRMTGEFDITRLAGLLTDDEGRKLRHVVAEGRSLSRQRATKMETMFK